MLKESVFVAHLEIIPNPILNLLHCSLLYALLLQAFQLLWLVLVSPSKAIF